MSAAAIATSDPRATEVGADVLRGGGNCVDAAVASALVLFVVEPHYCGPGGDAFLLAMLPGMRAPEVLDGAGAVPQGLTPAALEEAGLPGVPAFGAGSVSAPGAVAMLEASLERHGTRSLASLAAPAIELAEGGFAARPTLAGASRTSAERLAADPVLAPLYLPGGRPLEPGARVRNPRLGELLREIGARGAEVLYRGPVAKEIAETVRGAGGYLSDDDLAAHRTASMTPVPAAFRGARVWELPEPTQGPAVTSTLGALERAGRFEWPEVVDAVVAGLAAVGVDLRRGRARGSGTTYVAAIDADGGGASLITSVFAPFGSGLGVEALGGPLQNRAAGFRMLRRPPRPGAKPPHTIIPGLVTRDGEMESVLGVTGGLMQVQGQVQLLVRLLVHGLPPQEAVDAPRFRVTDGGEVALEPGHPLAASHPDAVGRPPGAGGFGGGQVASRRGGEVRAGADARRGGLALVVQPGEAQGGGRPRHP